MSSVIEEDGMAKRASQTGDARTTDRTGALCLGTDVNTRNKRRRWTAEQKHKIVAEGMEPNVSAATDRKSVLNSPLAARADCGQADRSGDTTSPGVLA
jgi:hypothetical protein